VDETASNDGDAIPVFLEQAEQSCRRCRKHYEMQAECCPSCGASNPENPSPHSSADTRANPNDQALLTVCLCYGVMLGAHALWGMVLSAGLTMTPEQLVRSTVLIDSIFCVATLIAWWKTRAIGRMDPLPSQSHSYEAREGLHAGDPPVISEEFSASGTWKSVLAAWLLALPLLALALAGNYAYHYVLTHFVGLPVDDDYLSQFGSLTATILIVCVEPALMEEFFFRGVAWKVLQPLVGRWGTLLVTSVMFGMAHIGVPLSVPALFGVGLFLGGMRLWSGGLLLPMLLHFLHNLTVVLYQGPS